MGGGEGKGRQQQPLITVECKSDNVTIQPADYGQGDNYSRLAGARFFVTHNSRRDEVLARGAYEDAKNVGGDRERPPRRRERPRD
ncbi:MAG: type I restriction enzyme HsdR N-terminal domain-containing protein [Blastocatellia bacterium]|nr:type I restriction enzyme HsdR N-terminal domain-containing protein [Blastocatellia bacterium]